MSLAACALAHAHSKIGLTLPHVRQVSWCLWAVPDDPAESVWHVNSFNDDETLSSAKGCEPQNSGGSAARSDALEHRRGSDSATAASALGFKQASLGQVALARSTKAPAKSIHGKSPCAAPGLITSPHTT